MLFPSSLAVLLAGSVASVVAQQGYGNGTSPGTNESLANAPYSTSTFMPTTSLVSGTYVSRLERLCSHCSF